MTEAKGRLDTRGGGCLGEPAARRQEIRRNATAMQTQCNRRGRAATGPARSGRQSNNGQARGALDTRGGDAWRAGGRLGQRRNANAMQTQIK